MPPKHDESYGGSEVFEIETRIRLIHGNSTSFVFEGHNSDPYIYTQYHSGLNYPTTLIVFYTNDINLGSIGIC